MNLNDPEVQRLLVTLALRTLSNRLLTLVALLLNTGVFVWAMSTDSWPRMAGAFGFALTSWCVIYLRPAARGEGDET